MAADLFLSHMAAPYRDGQSIDATQAEHIGHARIDAYDFDPWHPGDLQTLALMLGVQHGDPDLGATSGPHTVAAFRRRLVLDPARGTARRARRRPLAPAGRADADPR